jgi:molecular chaperone GrpE (heat shock protein)
MNETVDNQDIFTLQEVQKEIDQVLVGTLKACVSEAPKEIESLKGIMTHEWQNAARTLLMARRTRILSAMSESAVEAVANGLLSMHDSICRAIEATDEQAAIKAVERISAQHLKVVFNNRADMIHSLSVGPLYDALMDAYVSGANSRCN